MAMPFLGPVFRGRTPIYAVLLTLVTQVGVTGLNVATGVVTARLLGPEGRGILGAATIWPQFLAGLAVLGLPSALVYYLRTEPGSRDAIISAAFALSGTMSLIATVGGLMAVAVMMRDYAHDVRWLGYFCVAWTGVYLFTVTLRQILAASGRFQILNASHYVPAVSYLILLLLTAAVTCLSPTVAAFCLMSPSAFVLAAILHATPRGPRQPAATRAVWRKRLLGYAARTAPTDLVTSILAYIDRIILIPLLPTAVLGTYVVVYSFSRIFLILQVAASSVLFPLMTGRPLPQLKDLHDLALRLVTYAATAGILSLTVLAEPLLRLFYGADFAGAAGLFQILAVEAGLTCMAQVTIQLYLSLNRAAYVSGVQVACLVVAVAGLLTLVPAFGATGAAYTLCAAAAMRAVLLLAGIKMRLKLDFPRIYPSLSDFDYVWARLMKVS